MNVLVINAGSSSLKYQLFDMKTNEVRAKGLCERIGIDGKYKHEANGKKVTGDTPMATHADAIRHLTKMLLDEEYGVIKSMSEIDAVGHRVLHGGQKFSQSVRVNDKVIEAMKQICAHYSIPIFDASAKSGIYVRNENFRKKYFQAPSDTAHLNSEGHDLFMNKGECFLLSL